jgi:hypothetical protein
MLWFRHNNDFRSTPQMKFITKALGAHGGLAAYRLLEVVCERCGSGEKYDARIVLAPPYTEEWLANEILLPDEDDPDNNEYDTSAQPTVKRLRRYMDIFYQAGFVLPGSHTGAGKMKNVETGLWEDTEATFATVEIVGFDGLMDAWTARKKRKGVGQGVGGGGYRRTE